MLSPTHATWVGMRGWAAAEGVTAAAAIPNASARPLRMTRRTVKKDHDIDIRLLIREPGSEHIARRAILFKTLGLTDPRGSDRGARRALPPPRPSGGEVACGEMRLSLADRL